MALVINYNKSGNNFNTWDSNVNESTTIRT